MADVSILSIAQDVDTVWHWNSDQYCHNDSSDERREVVSTTINRYAGDGDYGFFFCRSGERILLCADRDGLYRLKRLTK